ncbi:MAG: hypothetical protein COA86_19005, partial [Kangiella sp.]
MSLIKLLHKPGLIVMRGALEQVNEHCHHVLQVVFNLSSQSNKNTAYFSVDSNELNCAGVIIAPDTVHRVEAVSCLIFLIEAESHLAKRLAKRYLDNNNFHCLSKEIIAPLIPNKLNMDFTCLTS